MTKTQTLLIVDDCDIDREVFREYLLRDSQTEYEIFEATEASEGLALCQEICCDLILLDFRLPDMTGLEFLQQRKNQAGPLPSVIMMTGAGCESIAVQALRHGAENYLSKDNLEAEILIRAVQDAIRQRHLRHTQGSSVLPEAMAAAVLRFRHSLELQPLLEATVNEIRHLAQCDRVSICSEQVSQEQMSQGETTHQFTGRQFTGHQFTGSAGLTSEPEIVLAEAQSLELIRQLRRFATAQQRRRRGRPPKYKVPPVELTPIRFPIHLPEQEQRWGWLLLEYLPNSSLLAAEEELSFEALIQELAIAISHAQLYKAALEQSQANQSSCKEKSDSAYQILLDGRTVLSNVLTAANTLAQHRAQLNVVQQERLLKQLENKSREFIQLLEKMARI